jgi:hypothetical protein
MELHARRQYVLIKLHARRRKKTPSPRALMSALHKPNVRLQAASTRHLQRLQLQKYVLRQT